MVGPSILAFTAAPLAAASSSFVTLIRDRNLRKFQIKIELCQLTFISTIKVCFSRKSECFRNKLKIIKTIIEKKENRASLQQTNSRWTCTSIKPTTTNQ